MSNTNKYVPVDAVGVVDETQTVPTDDDTIPEEQEYSSTSDDDDDYKNNIIKSDVLLSIEDGGDFELRKGIDYDEVEELVEDIGELRNGFIILLVLFATIAGIIFSLDDHYNNSNNEKQQLVLVDYAIKPRPHMGHKLQINASAFTVNDFECLQLDTSDWPSERVHCELRPAEDDHDDDDIAHYDFVVEHFDDEYCQQLNTDNPSVRHTASGCFYFEGYNHSYNDKCHINRTFTVSAFFGPGCLTPMPVTSVNLLPEDAGV